MNNKTLRVAVATKDGVAINEHFGHAKSFYIYDVTAHSVNHIETREVPHYCLGGHSDKAALPSILETIADCKAVLVAKIGDGPTEKLQARGIEAVSQYTWEEVIPSLRDYGTKYQESIIE
jgi:predicted Fe-Mo cluster-binding NifX family protein